MNEKHEIATTKLAGDVFVAVLDGDKTYVYGPDGDEMITFYFNIGNTINDLTLRLIVQSHFAGINRGKVIGEERARAEIRRALGL